MERVMKKGIVFSLDAAIAVTIVLILLVNTSYYFSTASRESVSQLHLIRIGNDVMHMLDLTGDLRRAITDDYKISPRMDPVIDDEIVNVSEYLPQGYDMKVLIFDMGETEVNIDNARHILDPIINNGRCNLLPIPPNPSSPEVGCTCDTHGCNGTFNVTTPSLEKATLYGLRLNITSYGNMTINISNNGGESYGVFNTTAVFPIPYNYSGMNLANVIMLKSGENDLLIKTLNATLHWYTILGAKEYAGSVDKAVPILVNETFIGSGEKFIAINETYYYDFGRLVRYYIWVK